MLICPDCIDKGVVVPARNRPVKKCIPACPGRYRRRKRGSASFIHEVVRGETNWRFIYSHNYKVFSTRRYLNLGSPNRKYLHLRCVGLGLYEYLAYIHIRIYGG